MLYANITLTKVKQPGIAASACRRMLLTQSNNNYLFMRTPPCLYSVGTAGRVEPAVHQIGKIVQASKTNKLNKQNR